MQGIFQLFNLLLLIFVASDTEAAAIINKDDLFPIEIIHINDFHARYVETNWASTTCKEKLGQVCIGGYARTITVVKKLLREKADKNPIYLNIGDNFQGTLWFDLLGWNVTSHFLNLLPADATTLGNHEFDRGIAGVVPFMETLKSPIIVANIDDSQEPTFQGKYKKSIVIERSGRKIGLIGAIVATTSSISVPGKLIFLDEVQTVKKEAERLKKEEDVDIIIVLSHCGLKIDREMAMNGGNIDVIVGGHSHDLLYTGTPVPGPDKPKDVYPIETVQSNGHKVLIVQASAYTKYLGDLTVYFDDAGEIKYSEGNPIFLEGTIEEDPEIVKELQPWKQEVDKVALKELGTLLGTLNKPDCATDECTFGNFAADAFVDYIVNHPDYQEEGAWAYATISMTNAGGIRTSLNGGIITFDDLFTALPFQNTIDTFELQGKDLLEVLEMSGSSYDHYNFLQYSGIRVIYNVTLPAMSRVVSAHVLCRKCEVPKYEPLDVNEWYRFAMPSWIGGGGNGFTPFTRRRAHKKGELKDVDIVATYLTKHSPYLPKRDGRIKVLH
jgi:5'-nucleotidase